MNIVDFSEVSILKEYQLDEKELHDAYTIIERNLSSIGVKVIVADLSFVVEKFLKKFNSTKLRNDSDSHHETAISDGQIIYLHDDLVEVGGIKGRLYDIIHLGLGHLWQWSCVNKDALRYTGDHAWEVGTNFYLGGNDSDLLLARDYEYEASCLGLQNLKILLKTSNLISPSTFNNITKFYNDYLATDLDYIINYYSTGVVTNFYKEWHLNSNEFPDIKTDFEIVIKPRKNKCIPLINLRNH